MLKRREFVQQAHKYTGKQDINSWLVSEKLDGTRCFWDGGISRGKLTLDIPWANIYHPKTGAIKPKLGLATGLWSRYSNPIEAPDWWLNQLPCMPLDGELWAGRGNFQLCRSIVAKDIPVDSEWEKIEYPIFGSPSFEAMFCDGEIRNTNFKRDIRYQEVKKWLNQLDEGFLADVRFIPVGTKFQDEVELLMQAIPSAGSIVYLHQQIKLPTTGADVTIEKLLGTILDKGGEGIVIRNPAGIWTPHRSHDILKYKPFDDDEGTLVGFTSGRATDKGSKLLGKIGALILDYNGKRLELSGLTDQEREFETLRMIKFATERPGVDMPSDFQSTYFKLGQPVTFKYRELSDEGIPKEARYFRTRDREI